MNSIALVASRRPPQVATGRVIVHVGVDRHPIRGQAVWPIADVLGIEDQMDAMVAGTVEDDAASAGQSTAAELLHDLLDSQMIAPPRPRRRRQRTVSSRAVFYQGSDRQDG
jgi:hypothetical protein